MTTLGKATIEFSEVKENITLPRQGTTMSKVVHIVHANPGGSSQLIAQILNLQKGDENKERTVSDVSSYLTLLKSKGLVEVLEYRRGLAGGSAWKVSDACRELIEG